MLGGSWRATTIKDSNKTAASTAVVFIWAFPRIVDLWRVHRLQSLTVMVTSKYLSTKGVCKLPANHFSFRSFLFQSNLMKPFQSKKKTCPLNSTPYIHLYTLSSQNNETPFATTIPPTVSPPQLSLGQRPANWDHSPNDPTAPRGAVFAARYVWHGPTRWSLVGSKGSREGSRKFDVLSDISTPTFSDRHAFSTHFDGFLMVYEKAVYISFHDPFLKTEVQDSLGVGVFCFLGWMNILNSRRSRPFTALQTHSVAFFLRKIAVPMGCCTRGVINHRPILALGQNGNFSSPQVLRGNTTVSTALIQDHKCYRQNSTSIFIS